MALDFSGPLKVTLQIPYTEGQNITLFVRRPTWDEGDEMTRMISEQNLRIVALWNEANPGASDGTPQDRKAAMESVSAENRALIVAQVKALERKLDRQVAAKVMEFIVGFQDTDDHGNPLFLNGGSPLRSSDDRKTWESVLQEALAPALPGLWDRLAQNARPDEFEVKFQGDLAKNSTPASNS